MSGEPAPDAELEAQADQFASRLTETVTGVLGPTAPAFVVEGVPRRDGTVRLVVKPDCPEIPLYINDEHALDLTVKYECTWDHRERYLTVKEAAFHVLSEFGDPIFRYEFLADARNVPAAHLHVHAHRDEILYSLVRASRGKAKTRSGAITHPRRKPPRLASLHFPMGGPRMRPALEDVLQMLVAEFCIDSERDSLDVLERGRTKWRRDQVAACTRDAPDEAIRSLRDLGYSVEWVGEDPAPTERTDKLIRY